MALTSKKKASFQYLLSFHKPTVELLPYRSWYYPPTREDDSDVKILHTYLKGLSYLDVTKSIRLMPAVAIHPEILKLAKGKLVTGRLVLRASNWYSALHPGGFVIRPHGTVAGKEKEYNGQYFTFTPTKGGYTKIRYHDPHPSKAGAEGMASDRNGEDMDLHVYEPELRPYVMNSTQRNRHTINEFHLVLVAPGEEPKNEVVKVMMGRKGDTKGKGKYQFLQYCDWSTKGKCMGYDSNFVSFKEANKYKKTLIVDLVLTNLAEVKTKLKSSFNELSGEESVTDVGESVYSFNEALRFCQLIGKCKSSE